MGHIELAAPVSHIWFFKGTPSRMGLVLDMSPWDLEEVLYFVSYVVLDPGITPLQKKQTLSDKEYSFWNRNEISLIIRKKVKDRWLTEQNTSLGHTQARVQWPNMTESYFRERAKYLNLISDYSLNPFTTKKKKLSIHIYSRSVCLSLTRECN